VRGAVDETASVRSLLLEPLEGGEVPPHRAGQIVTVRLGDPAGGAPVVRSYSLSAAPDGRSLRISVKRDGAASAIVLERVAVGHSLELGAPRGAFVLDPQATSPVLLISAGIGVTPVLAMLAELSDRPASRAVTWVHVARSGAEHALAREARRLLERLPDAEVHIRYTHPEPGDRLGADFDAVGRLTVGDLAALGAGPGSEAYVCGPARFMRVVVGSLINLGVEAGRIHTEAFGAAVVAGVPPHAPDRPPAAGAEVTFARSGVAARFDPRRWHSLLELARHATSPRAGRAARASVTAARAASSPAASPTTPSRSTRRRPG
jgi:ferredoxin-NADP reductase